MSSELTEGDNEGCQNKPRGLNRDMALPLAGDGDGASTDSRRDPRNFMRNDYDEVRLNAADDHFAVEHLAAHGEGCTEVWVRILAERRFDGSKFGARLDRASVGSARVNSDFLNRRIQYKESINAAENI